MENYQKLEKIGEGKQAADNSILGQSIQNGMTQHLSAVTCHQPILT